ncbi:DUF4133 domain-containing protein [Sphingobacterium sp. DR205]|uniref:DUF4133 domain-containing protein n=1 Tax=Sphingobacterium sp. DR205 TaxID=2713573 RepID=UPI001F49FF74|nr:DUF4133 domain-containing protein [Sphingobacterium sp. DR205]
MMPKEINYSINKGINRPIEFRGLRGQYIIILAIGLLALLMGFSIIYIAGVPLYFGVPAVLMCGSGLFGIVYRLNAKYGQYGLMKAMALRKVPTVIYSMNRKRIFEQLKKSVG